MRSVTCFVFFFCCFFFLQAEDGIRDLVRSRGLGDVYKRQELHRAGAAIANVACQRQGALADRRSGGGADAGRGSLLDHLLVASLDRALALAQVHDVAERILSLIHISEPTKPY